MTNRIAFDGTTGLTYYAAFIDVATTKYLKFAGGDATNPANYSWETYNSAHWTSYAIPMTELALGTFYLSAVMPAGYQGDLWVQIYRQAGGSPATSDARQGDDQAYWDGSSFSPSAPASGGGSNVGPGSTSCTLTLTNTTASAVVANASAWISTDAAGTNVIAGTLSTNSSGQVTFLLDDGVIYYAWFQKDGINSVLASLFTASSSGASFTTTSAATPSVIAGYYGSQTDMENVFGTTNIEVYSDLENNAPAQLDLTRVQAASDYADDQINNFFYEGPFTVPLSFTQAWARTAARYWYAKLAGTWLYQSRGVRDDDGAAKRYVEMTAQVFREMAQYKSGALRLGAQRRWPSPTAPVGVDA